jgi:HK97 family phage portal protein
LAFPLFERFRAAAAAFRQPVAAPPTGPMAMAEFMGPDDPRFKEWLRNALLGGGGGGVSVAEAMANPAVKRGMDLLSGSVAMLPLSMVRSRGMNPVALPDHPLHRVLAIKPNPWMSPFDFKRVMMLRLLQDGRAFAQVVRLNGRVTGLIPLWREQVRYEQDYDYEPRYWLRDADGRERRAAPGEILHLRDMDYCGPESPSRIQHAAEAIMLAQAVQVASRALFDNNLKPGGIVTHPKTLSPAAQNRILESIEARKGAANAGRWMVLEEGMSAAPWVQSLADSQGVEQMRMQVEQISRVLGIPRPLMMMDETNWGSGVEQLGHLFVRFGLNMWFRIFEEAINVTLLPEADLRAGVSADFDESELLRGTMKDLATFLGKALGGGGSASFLTQNEARNMVGYAAHDDGNELFGPSANAAAGDGREPTDQPENQP